MNTDKASLADIERALIQFNQLNQSRTYRELLQIAQQFVSAPPMEMLKAYNVALEGYCRAIDDKLIEYPGGGEVGSALLACASIALIKASQDWSVVMSALKAQEQAIR